MKHTKRMIPFISGMLTALLLVGMTAPALAAGFSKYIEVSTGVSLYVDDAKLDPRDANGNPVEVFIYNGTTYLPVRAISETLEVPIQWDGSTRSVYVGKHTGDKPAVWLSQMDYFSGTTDKEFYTAQSDKDNLGNTHYHCITGNMDRTYKINGQYSNLTGTIYQPYYQRSESGQLHFSVYGDGELLYDVEYGDVTGIDPIDFNIDLTGILELRIYFFNRRYQGIWSHFDVFALGDIGFWT